MKATIRKKGFTLVELLVIISIILLLSAIVLPNYREGGRNLALQRTANKLAQDLRRAQEMTMSAKEIGKGIVPPGEEFMPRGGYGIEFSTDDPERYILFADCDNDHRLEYLPKENVCGPEGSEFSERIEEVFLEEGVIAWVDPLMNFVSVVFIPPDPIVSFCNAPAGWCPNETSPQVSIRLCFEEKSHDCEPYKMINVNRAGLVSIE